MENIGGNVTFNRLKKYFNFYSFFYFTFIENDLNNKIIGIDT